ncbi:hypothetical protein K491DRAFT_672588 [Lophiostoma macrostomum CBS 122681]|uniref:Uncharacterized protein n=1 Tax=Lophiostoma macrostomum CBS 122681 TaxID=1314788 RepID=A0A6A6TSD7_9PLEO|nr:hypothetical protein K491DRAFT_672588 [Lophiostoma macrostomum CBS 122681]
MRTASHKWTAQAVPCRLYIIVIMKKTLLACLYEHLTVAELHSRFSTHKASPKANIAMQLRSLLLAIPGLLASTVAASDATSTLVPQPSPNVVLAPTVPTATGLPLPPPICGYCNDKFHACLAKCGFTFECHQDCECEVCEIKDCELMCNYTNCCAQADVPALETTVARDPVSVAPSITAGPVPSATLEVRDSIDDDDEGPDAAGEQPEPTATECPECNHNFIDCMTECHSHNSSKPHCESECNARICEDKFCEYRCGWAKKCRYDPSALKARNTCTDLLDTFHTCTETCEKEECLTMCTTDLCFAGPTLRKECTYDGLCEHAVDPDTVCIHNYTTWMKCRRSLGRLEVVQVWELTWDVDRLDSSLG